MRQKWIFAALLSVLFLCSASGLVLAKDYNYMKPETLKNKIDNEEPVDIVDIQVQKEFSEHHIKGAMSTCAYPVKSEEEKAKLDKAIEKYKSDAAPIVIVCPRGAGGAKRAYDYMEEKGIPKDRLFILEKGQGGWPYKDLEQHD